MILTCAITMNRDAETSDRNILSNLIVKSKLSRHPCTAGPKVSSFRHAENAIMNDLVEFAFPQGLASGKQVDWTCAKQS